VTRLSQSQRSTTGG